MFEPQQYQLVDFGRGRRLERFGQLLLDRPCLAAATMACAAPQLWAAADARYELAPCHQGSSANDSSDRIASQRGRWFVRKQSPSHWTVAHDRLIFELKRTVFGHVGLFPEQAENWNWIAQQVKLCISSLSRRPKVLNLFAYTGGSTLAAAAAGAEVTHVDAARNMVAWARRNAELSGLRDAPIRWIAEDAMKFVQRELRRGKRYDAIILDPPSYGHGTHGEIWQLGSHLPELLALCAELTAPRSQFLLITCHTPGYPPERLREMLAAAFPGSSSHASEASDLILRDSNGRTLPNGVVARAAAES